MTKLNQVIAIEKGVKSRHTAEMSQIYKLAQKPDLFHGFHKNYQKIDDASEDLPPERKVVQISTADILRAAQRTGTELLDLTFAKDKTNCVAKATVTLDGQEIVKDAPVSYLLFLEKQLTDLKTLVEAIPALDDAEEWSRDPNSGLFKSGETKTHRTKKLQKPIVMYDATPEHPAQTQLITEDVLVGHWASIKHSGAMPKTERQAMVGRIEKLLNAVKEAREEANMQEVADLPSVADKVFGYVLSA